MGNVTNVKLGTCSVTFNGSDLGHTMGPIDYAYEPEYSDVKVDAYGSTKVNSYLKGEKVTVKVPLAEFTIANMKVAIPAATFAGAANARITVGRQAGLSMLAQSGQLVLHPVNNGTRADDIVLHKAVVMSVIELSHSIDDQKVIEVTFEAFIDESKSNGNYLGLIGDSTA